MLAPLTGCSTRPSARRTASRRSRSCGARHGPQSDQAGPVNVSDYVLVYARERGAWRANPQWCPRDGYDAAYGKFVPNRGESIAAGASSRCARMRAARWGSRARRRPSPAGAPGLAGHREVRDRERRSRRPLRAAARGGGEPRGARVDRALEAKPQTTLRLGAPATRTWCSGGGTACSSSPTRCDGRACSSSRSRTCGTTSPFQGIAREGGRGLRAEQEARAAHRAGARDGDRRGRLGARSVPRSGTTAAVAHKMGRRWVGIERGRSWRRCACRGSRASSRGEDATGITRARGWRGRGLRCVCVSVSSSWRDDRPRCAPRSPARGRSRPRHRPRARRPPSPASPR